MRYNLGLYLPVVTGIPALIGYIAVGGLKRSFKYSPIIWYVLFSAWLVIVIPFSAWPGGSFPVMSGFFRTQVIFLLFLSGLVYNYRDLRLVIYSICAAGFLNVLTAEFMSKQGERLELESIVTIGNSNDLAAQLLMIAPLLWAASKIHSVPSILRWALLGVLGWAFMVCLQTASRGAVLAMAAGYIVVLLFSRGWQRAALAFAVPMLFFLLLLFTPATIVNRLATLTNDENTGSEASESRLGRTELMKRGLVATLQNPIFGLGPGQFSNAIVGGDLTNGRMGRGMMNHSSFLQISSEAGLPALLLFTMSLIASWRKTASVRRRAILHRHKELEIISLALMLSIVMFSVAAFFLTLAYRLYFPVLVSFAVALYIAAERELPQDARIR